MRIGELADEAGVSTKTIRYYEQVGVLPEPNRAPNGYREYGAGAVDRLTFVRDAQATGLTLTEIASILEMRNHGEATCQHVVDLLRRHLDDLDRHIETLRRTREHLAALTTRAGKLDPADCIDPNRCQTIAAGADAGAAHAHPAPHRHTHD